MMEERVVFRASSDGSLDDAMRRIEQGIQALRAANIQPDEVLVGADIRARVRIEKDVDLGSLRVFGLPVHQAPYTGLVEVSGRRDRPSGMRPGRTEPLNRPRVGGGWLLRRGEREHQCRPPGGLLSFLHRLRPGAEWECDCGQAWRLQGDPETASWWERR